MWGSDWDDYWGPYLQWVRMFEMLLRMLDGRTRPPRSLATLASLIRKLDMGENHSYMLSVTKKTWGSRIWIAWQIWKHTIVLYIFATSTFVHGQSTSAFAFHCVVMAKHLLLRNTTLVFTKQWNTTYVMFLVCANIFWRTYKQLFGCMLQASECISSWIQILSSNSGLAKHYIIHASRSSNIISFPTTSNIGNIPNPTAEGETIMKTDSQTPYYKSYHHATPMSKIRHIGLKQTRLVPAIPVKPWCQSKQHMHHWMMTASWW